MYTLFGTAIGFVILLAAWSFWKRSFRDFIRDELFDMRDAWRRFWLESGRDLADPAYGAFRHEINCYLRYTSTYRFSDLVYVSRNCGKIKAIMASRGEQEITGDNEVVQEMKRLRKEAIDSLQVYMVATSIFIVPVLVLTIGVVFMENLTLAASFIKTTVDLANKVSIGRPETIMQAARLKLDAVA